jgi:hypothetical protein
MPTPKQLVTRWVEIFNRADVDGLPALYAPDAVNHQVAEAPVEGRAAILEWRDPLGLRGCGFFRVVAGLIVFQRGYWDKLSFLRLHGFPMPVQTDQGRH